MNRQFSTALITGASSGIGEAYALAVAEKGNYNLLLVARRSERLRGLRSKIEQKWEKLPWEQRPGVREFSTDLSSNSARLSLLEQLEEEHLEVDMLVNNAGFGSLVRFSESEAQRELSMLEVNCAAPLHFCHYFLPLMQSRAHGIIINVCSTAAYQPMPYMATYAATKAFLLHFTVALASEARESGVTVLAHCPGPTQSEFHLTLGLTKKVDILPAATAQQVVAEALLAAQKRQTICINGLTNRCLAGATRFLSKKFSARLVKSTLEKWLSK